MRQLQIFMFGLLLVVIGAVFQTFIGEDLHGGDHLHGIGIHDHTHEAEGAAGGVLVDCSNTLKFVGSRCMVIDLFSPD